MPNLTPAEKEMAVALSKAATSSGLGLLGGPLRRVLARAAIAASTKPEPTWRDVIRAILPTGPRLYRRSSESGLRSWQYDTLVKCPSGSHSGILVMHEAREDRWVVRFDGPKQYLTLRDPSPADVLTAARLAGLGGDSDA
jgi:hypothetical protein